MPRDGSVERLAEAVNERRTAIGTRDASQKRLTRHDNKQRRATSKGEKVARDPLPTGSSGTLSHPTSEGDRSAADRALRRWSCRESTIRTERACRYMWWWWEARRKTRKGCVETGRCDTAASRNGSLQCNHDRRERGLCGCRDVLLTLITILIDPSRAMAATLTSC